MKDGNHNVVGWTFTTGVGHEEIRECLNGVKSRTVEKLLYVLVDDCCSSRKLYEEIFGKYIVVKLDLFHAIQRITNCLPAKYIHRQTISRKIRMIFRKVNDRGTERREATDCKENIMSNLEQLVKELDSLGKDRASLTLPSADEPKKGYYLNQNIGSGT